MVLYFDRVQQVGGRLGSLFEGAKGERRYSRGTGGELKIRVQAVSRLDWARARAGSAWGRGERRRGAPAGVRRDMYLEIVRIVII